MYTCVSQKTSALKILPSSLLHSRLNFLGHCAMSSIKQLFQVTNMKGYLLEEFMLIVIVYLIPLLSFTIYYNKVGIAFQRWIFDNYIFIYHRGNIADNIIFIKIGSKIFSNISIDCFNIRSSIANLSSISNRSFHMLHKNVTY